MSLNSVRGISACAVATLILAGASGAGAETFFRTGVEFWETGGRNQLIWWSERDDATNVYRFKYRFSDNGGKSWADTAVMWETDGSIDISEIDDLIIRKRGKLLIPISVSDESTKCFSIRFLGSGDYGETWTLRDPVFERCGTVDTITGSYCPRMDTYYSPPSAFRLVTNIRMTPDTATSFLITSSDGKTWKSREIGPVPLDCRD